MHFKRFTIAESKSIKKSTSNPTIIVGTAVVVREIDKAAIDTTMAPMLPINKHFKLLRKQCENLAHVSLQELKNVLNKI